MIIILGLLEFVKRGSPANGVGLIIMLSENLKIKRKRDK